MARTRSKRPTLRTISDLCGLAVPTVSRALNDAPDIGQATKVRVREIANQIGYVPDRAGLRLRTGKTNVIAVVMGADDEVTDHAGKLVGAIAQGLRNTPYHLIVMPHFSHEDPMVSVRYVVETRSADALILNRIGIDDPRVSYLMEREFPFVTYGRSRWRQRHAYFDFDNTWFGRAAVETLHGAGCKSLVLIAPPEGQNYARDMVTGMQHSAEECGIVADILPDVTSDDPGQTIQDALRSHILANPRLDGVICPSATTAIRTTVAIEALGKTLGKDIHIFAKESLDFLRHFRQPIRSLREDVALAGKFLAQAAIQRIEHPDNPPMQQTLEGDLHCATGSI